MPTESPENKGEQTESEKRIGFTRRDLFMALAGAATSFIALRYGKYLIPHNYHDYESLKVKEKGFEDEISILEEKYSCKINLEYTEHKEEALKVLRKALSKYPPDFIKKLKIKFIFEKLNCDHVAFADGRYLKKGGEADICNGEISIIDMPEEVIHHEICHISESSQFFTDQCSESDQEAKSQEEINWVNLNPEKEKAYIKDEFGSTDNDITSMDGFVMPLFTYSRKNAGEDRAVIMGYLLAKYGLVMQLADKDKVLANKVMELKENYFRFSDGKMNYQYWEDLKNGKVNEEYWDK